MIRIYSCHFPINQVSSFRKMKKKKNPNLSEDELESVIKGRMISITSLKICVVYICNSFHVILTLFHI